MSIYAKKQTLEQQNHKVGQIDEKYLKQAEDLLYSEFSLSLGIPQRKVPEYIAARVDAANAKQVKQAPR
jgi:CarD family transcriptional regulator